ncbi:MAG TPA: TonB-dependent receptor [Allosphingosinicella sp.]|nr:TonB-dependent receptor [Allosphingosinicella sp.]
MKNAIATGRLTAEPLGWIMAAAAANCFAAGQALAQDQTRPPAPAAEAADASAQDGVEEIIVQANKRRERLQDVPIAITAVTGARLDSVGITNTQDIASVVPGLVIQSTISGVGAHLRGIGTTAVGIGLENSVATYVDNVYIYSVSGSLVQLNNIDQIEVLKGPQGTLFGRNATGGVINIRTRDPKHEPGGDFSLSYGNYDTIAAKGYLTAGLTKDLAADIAGFVSLQGKGWGKNFFTGHEVNKLDQYAVRSKWLFTPGDRDQFRLIGDYSLLKGDTFSTFSVLKGTTVNYGPGDTPAAARPDLVNPPVPPYPVGQPSFVGDPNLGLLAPFAVVGNPYTFNRGFYDIDNFYDPRYKFKTGGGSLQWDHDFDSVRFTSITAYRAARQKAMWSSVPTPADRSAAFWTTKERQLSQELQLGSATNAKIQWVVGLYYLNAKGEYPSFNIIGSTLSPLERLEFQSVVTTKSGAAFGQATVPLWEGAHFTGGLRYTVERRGNSGATILHLLPAFGGISIPMPIVPAHTTFRKLTWRAALDQKLTPNIMAYASYNRGFKSGVYNAIPAGGDAIEPEVLDSWEAGLKTDLLNRKLRFNIGGFYYKYKNLQVTVFTPISATLDNGAAAEVYGVDIDFTAKLDDNLTLFGGATLLHSEFTSYPEAGFFVPVPAAQGGGTAKHIASAKGNKLPYTSNTTFNVGANYVVPIGDGGLDLNANYAYTSRWFSGPDNILSQKPYGLLDASATYRFPGDHFSLGLWARNITDEKYRVYLASGGNPGGYEQGNAAAPRTYGVRAGYKF